MVVHDIANVEARVRFSYPAPKLDFPIFDRQSTDNINLYFLKSTKFIEAYRPGDLVTISFILASVVLPTIPVPLTKFHGDKISIAYFS